MRVRYSFGARHTGHLQNIRKQRGKFPKVMRDVLNISDIVLEVLDARFIKETRNLKIEEYIKDKGKKIIYVLNKSDLIDIDELKKQIDEAALFPYSFVSCLKRKGIKELRDKIKMEIKRADTDFKRAHVGIIGYPNVGKSSLINLLTGKTSAKVGAESGFTKGMQMIKLTDGILILDTPGVIPEERYSTDDRKLMWKHAKLNAKSYDKVREPEFVVHKLMEDFSGEIQEFYGVDAKNDSEVLIEMLGRKRNYLKKGGEVDIDRAARLVVRDWQLGNIRARV